MKFEDVARRKIYHNDEHLCNQGLKVESLFKIVKGKCKTLRVEKNGNLIMLSYYNNYGFVGDVEYFSEDTEAYATIIAIGDVEVYSLSLERVKQYFKNDNDFTWEVATALNKKFMESALQNSENILLSVEERLLSFIQFSFGKGKVEATLKDIAMQLGTSYRQLLRCVKTLVDKGFLEKRADGYYLLK